MQVKHSIKNRPVPMENAILFNEYKWILFQQQGTGIILKGAAVCSNLEDPAFLLATGRMIYHSQANCDPHPVKTCGS